MWFAASRLSYIGIFFGVAICIGYFAGHWVDGRFHTQPWLGVVGLLVGAASAFRELIRITRQFQKMQDRPEALESERPKEPKE